MERRFRSKFLSLLANDRDDLDATFVMKFPRVNISFMPNSRHKLPPGPQANEAYDRVGNAKIPNQNFRTSVKNELGNLKGLAREELDFLRKKFAFVHHPDRHVGRSKVMAEERMSIANQLLDDALETHQKN